jgi:hypothetical protein
MKKISRNTKRKNKQYRKKRHLRTRKLQSYIVAMGGNGEEEEEEEKYVYHHFLYSFLDSIRRLNDFKKEQLEEKKETKKRETKKTATEKPATKKINDEKIYIENVSKFSPEEYKNEKITYDNINMTPIEYIFENIDDSNLVGTLSTYYTIKEEIAQNILNNHKVKEYNKKTLLGKFPQYEKLKKEPSPPKLPGKTDIVLPPEPPTSTSQKKRDKTPKPEPPVIPSEEKIIPEEIIPEKLLDLNANPQNILEPPPENSREQPPPPPPQVPSSGLPQPSRRPPLPPSRPPRPPSPPHNNPIEDVMKKMQEMLIEGFKKKITSSDLNLNNIEMCKIVKKVLPTYNASTDTKYKQNDKEVVDTPQDIYEYNMLLCAIFIILGIITPFFNQNTNSPYKIIMKGGKATQFLLHEFRKDNTKYITNDIDFLVVPKDDIDYNFYEIKYIATYISNIINQFLNVENKISILIPDHPQYITNPRINPYVIKVSYRKSSGTGFRALCDIGFDPIEPAISDFFTYSPLLMETVNISEQHKTRLVYEYPSLKSMFHEKIYYTILYNNNTTKNEHEKATQEKFAKTVLLLAENMPISSDYKGKERLQIIRDAVDTLFFTPQEKESVMKYFESKI